MATNGNTLMIKETEIRLNEAHQRYKRGEITFKELEPIIEEYRNLVEKELKKGNQLKL